MTPAAVSEYAVYGWAERLEENSIRGAYGAGEHTDAPKLLGSFAYCTLRPVGTATASRAGHLCRMRTVAGGTQRCVLDGLQRNANHSQITLRAQASSEPLQNALGTTGSVSQGLQGEQLQPETHANGRHCSSHS